MQRDVMLCMYCLLCEFVFEKNENGIEMDVMEHFSTTLQLKNEKNEIERNGKQSVRVCVCVRSSVIRLSARSTASKWNSQQNTPLKNFLDAFCVSIRMYVKSDFQIIA